MKFILTSQKEENLKGLIGPYHYKFLDVEVLKKDFVNTLSEKTSKYQDLHFNAYLINKFQNNFKSSKSQFFIYRTPDINENLINNILSFINTKYPEKFKQFLLISECIDNLDLAEEILKKFTIISYTSEIE